MQQGKIFAVINVGQDGSNEVTSIIAGEWAKPIREKTASEVAQRVLNELNGKELNLNGKVRSVTIMEAGTERTFQVEIDAEGNHKVLIPAATQPSTTQTTGAKLVIFGAGILVGVILMALKAVMDTQQDAWEAAAPTSDFMR